MGLMDFCNIRGSFCDAGLYLLFPIPLVPGSCRASHDPRALDVQSTSASGSPTALCDVLGAADASGPVNHIACTTFGSFGRSDQHPTAIWNEGLFLEYRPGWQPCSSQ